jgi:hypothetical protein
MRQAACTYRSGDPELGVAIAYLRDVLGEQTYEVLAQRGEAMTAAAMVPYVRDHVEKARAQLNAVPKWTLVRLHHSPASASADRPKHCRDDGTVCRGPAARNSARRT